MKVDRLYYPVTTLGPGERLVMWTAGCSKHCVNCANPELWQALPTQEIPIDTLASAMKKIAEEKDCHRLTITGGDPLEQPEELLPLLEKLRHLFTDILVYTGYEEKDLDRILGTDRWQALKQHIDVLIDGPYVQELNDGRCGLRGSTNQQIIIYNDELRDEYLEAEKEPRQVQNALFNDQIISIGIHGHPAEQQ